MNKIEDISNSQIRFIRVLWCDNANIIRAKAVYMDSLKDDEVSVGISRGQQGVPVIYDGVVAGSDLDPVGEIMGDMSTLTPIPYAPPQSYGRYVPLWKGLGELSTWIFEKNDHRLPRERFGS